MVTQKDLKRLFSYDCDTGLFTRLVAAGSAGKVGDIAGGERDNGYLVVWINYKSYLVHRLVWLYVHGSMPEKNIDHINHDRKDNRIVNLRDVDQSINARNRNRKLSKHGVIGLSLCKRTGKFCVYITIEGKNKWLGRHLSFFDAVCARKSAENKYNLGWAYR